MARASIVLLLTVVTGASLLLAQTPSESQKPDSAQEKLNYFAGTWTLEVHMKTSLFGSRVFLETEHNEWMPGGSLLVSRQEGANALGSGGLTVLAYNAKDKTYTYHVVKSTGDVENLRGTLQGDTWTWTNNEATNHNKAPMVRLIIKELSSDSYSLKLETSSGARDWSTVMEGKANKAPTYSHQDVAFRR